MNSICWCTWRAIPRDPVTGDAVQDAYNRDYDGLDRMLDIRISRLRKKLGDDAENPERIKTIWGQGYLFVPDAW